MAGLENSTNIRLGLWLDDLRVDIKQALKIIQPLHVESLGLDAFSVELSPRTLGQTARRDVARFVRAKAALSALRADVGGRRLADPKTLDVNLSRLREAIQLALDLRAPYFVFPAGFVPAADDKENAVARGTLAEAARTLAGFSSTMGVRLCWLGGGEAPEVLAAFLNEIDSGGLLQVDLNPGAYTMRGVDPLKALNVLAPRVALARAVDHYRGGAEAPFGQGDVRWGEVLVGLSTLQRNAPLDVLAGCTLDGDRLGALAAACKKLHALRRNPLG